MNLMPMFPPLNASLNALSGVFLLLGYICVRRRNLRAHRFFMLSACATSVLFLCSYLTYHFFAGSTRFLGTGTVRTIYFAILISHTILAVVVVPLAIGSVWNGLRDHVETHRRISRWTFPIWMYVSVTGVLVYFFLYQWFPSR